MSLESRGDWTNRTLSVRPRAQYMNIYIYKPSMHVNPARKKMMQHDHKEEEDEAGVKALAACGSALLQYVINAAIQLDLFEIIAKAGDGTHISPTDIAAQIQTSNREAARALDVMLRFLVPHSFLTCSTIRLVNGEVERRYGLAPAGKFYVRDELGRSLAPYHALCCPGGTVMWYSLKDTVLKEGGTLFERIHGKNYYEFTSTFDSKTLERFDNAMGAHSSMTMKRALEVYNGFDELSSIVNVAGGNGITLDMIISKYPSIHGINFDLPEVIKVAPTYNGIEHVAGDMFVEVPKGDAILLKFVLHNWDDNKCLKLLENCYKALTDKGKVIVIDAIYPEELQPDIYSKFVAQLDVIMFANLGGKERTQSEFEALANRAGFAELKVMSRAYGTWIMEFVK